MQDPSEYWASLRPRIDYFQLDTNQISNSHEVFMNEPQCYVYPTL